MRHVFFSFHWADSWHVQQIRQSWRTKGSAAGFVDEAEMEALKRKDKASVNRWIDEQLKGASVTCVLIGAATHTREYVKYEIQKSIEGGKGLLGVYVHEIKGPDGKPNSSSKGEIPEGLPADISNTQSASSIPLLLHRRYPLSYRKWREARRSNTQSPSSIPVLSPWSDPISRRKWRETYRLRRQPLQRSRCLYYSWVSDNGYLNLGDWIEIAARQAGRD